MTLVRQHVIDPEICIRCNTCEETCPVDAITHNDDNYVVDAAICNFGMNCVAPCPTGAIDNWIMVSSPYPIDDQFEWEELPDEDEAAAGGGDGDAAPAEETGIDDEAAEILKTARQGAPSATLAPASAAKPMVDLYRRNAPAIAKVSGNLPITDDRLGVDVRHIILDFGSQAFPVLEGQSIGILPPGTDEKGKPHRMRLYSIASPRDGERPKHNNISLTVKRVVYEEDGAEKRGVASNYVCDLERGDEIQVTGPYGTAFLMPNNPESNIIMICTGTGAAPFRAMTEYRRRNAFDVPGQLMLFFGARTPNELPYFGPLQKLPTSFLDKELVFSRLPGGPKEYVQDRIRERGDDVAALLGSKETYIYICGLKGMEGGVDEALADIARTRGMDWKDLRTEMEGEGRFHVETY
ncbi:MAG: benzoyl-CoA 2,3-epoxidase subunit BoxA [Rhodospirillaceae bacterium]|jgi:benzoyl-CoA 2,3-epoxidase subunit A|nr:benzoyl-CoA 2,3-epoxidase subunit BoxA [Rhodospirillaceae bacterium]